MRGFHLVFVAAALGGCAGSPIVHSSYYNSAYTPSHVTLAAASGPSLAVIRFDPFPSDRDNAAVVAAMQGRNFGPKMFFTQTPRPDDRYGYKVVLDFSSASARYATQCVAPPTPAATTPPADSIVVTASFCVGAILLTDASGSISGVRGPDDPAFQRLIADLLAALTPPYDPNRRGDDWMDAH